MPNPTAVRLFDAVLGFLLLPRIRRLRRWGFVVTLPLGLLLGRWSGLELGDGAVLGVAVAVLDLAVVLGVAVGAARLLGQERRDALLDLLMHPVARRAMIGEARMLLTLPAAALRRLRPPAGDHFAARRGSHELGLALGLLPALLGEGAVVHLLIPTGWLWLHVALAVLHGYGMLMLVSWAVAQHTSSHRLHDGALELRSGRLYRVRASTADVATVALAPRRDGQRTGLVLGDGAPRLAVGGRTDVTVRFSSPVRLERPLGDPLWVTELAVAVDDPARFVDALGAAKMTRLPAMAERRSGFLAWLTPPELAEALA